MVVNKQVSKVRPNGNLVNKTVTKNVQRSGGVKNVTKSVQKSVVAPGNADNAGNAGRLPLAANAGNASNVGHAGQAPLIASTGNAGNAGVAGAAFLTASAGSPGNAGNFGTAGRPNSLPRQEAAASALAQAWAGTSSSESPVNFGAWAFGSR